MLMRFLLISPKFQRAQRCLWREAVCLEDLGSHVVDLAVWLFRRFESRQLPQLTQGLRQLQRMMLAFTVEGADGLVGKFDVSWRKKEYRMPEFGITVTRRKREAYALTMTK